MPKILTSADMPGVPLRPVGSSGVNGANTTIAQFGGVEAVAVSNLGRMVGDAGRAGADIAARRQAERDALDLQNAMIDAERDVGAYMIEASKKKMGAARGLHQSTSDYLTKYGEGLRKNLNPRIQDVFGQRFGELSNTALNRVAVHEHEEHEAERAESVTRSGAAQLNRIAANAGDDLEFARALRDYDAALELGVDDPKTRADLKAKFISDAHLQAIDRIGVDDPEAALAYFKEHEAEIAGVDHAGTLKPLTAEVARIRAVVEERAAKSAPLRVADEALGVEGSLFDKSEWIRAQERAGAIDTDVAEGAIRALEDRYSQLERSRNYETRAALEFARGEIFKGKRPDQLPYSVQARLAETGDWDALVSFHEKRAKGEEPVTDRALYYGLLDMAAGIDPRNPGAGVDPKVIAYFKDLDIQKYIVDGVLKNDADTARLLELQRKMRVGEAPDKEQRSIRSVSSVLTGVLAPYQSQEARGAMAQRFHDAVENYKDRNDGQEPDEAELTRIATGLQFNPPGKHFTYYDSTGEFDVASGLMRGVEVDGRPLPADVFGTMGRALVSAGKRGSEEEIVALAEALQSAGRDPSVPYSAEEYAAIIDAMGALR